MFISSGTLLYLPWQEGSSQKLILQIDQGLSDYYRALCPSYLRLNPQRYPAHISIVRNEVPPLRENWNKHQGKLIEFSYDPFVYNGTIYYWLNVFSTQLEELRLELGLEVSSIYTKPPDGYFKCFHTTIGNNKRL